MTFKLRATSYCSIERVTNAKSKKVVVDINLDNYVPKDLCGIICKRTSKLAL
jgi:hypothetical protein